MNKIIKNNKLIRPNPFFYCPYTLVMRCRRVSGIEPIWSYWISVSIDYTTLLYLMIWHTQTVGVSDLCCLEHTERSASVTEIAFKKSPRIYLGPYTKLNHPLQILYMISQFAFLLDKII